MPQDATISSKNDAFFLLTSLPASPSTPQLHQLAQLFEQAWTEATAAAEATPAIASRGRKGGGGDNGGMHIKLLAKEAGPLAMGLVKSLTGVKAEGVDQQQSRALCLLCARALDALDTVRSALTNKGYELEVQRYNLIRRMTLAGHTELAIQQGLRLHAALEAHASNTGNEGGGANDRESIGKGNSSQLEELSLACRLNLAVSVGEALIVTKSAQQAQQLLEQTLPALSALQLQLRSSSSKESAKHAESMFKYLYKFQIALAGFEEVTASQLQGQLFQVFCETADLVQQASKLHKYAAKLASDLAAKGAPSLLAGLLHYLGTGAGAQVSGVCCLEEVLRALTSKGVRAAQLSHVPGWQEAVQSNPAIGFVYAAMFGLTVDYDVPSKGHASKGGFPTHCQIAALLGQALKEAQDVLADLAIMLPAAQGSKGSSCAGPSSAPAEARLRELWRAMCFLQHALFEHLTTASPSFGEGAIVPQLAAAMQVQVAMATELARGAKTWLSVPLFQGSPDATIVQPGLLAAMVACKLHASTILAHAHPKGSAAGKGGASEQQAQRKSSSMLAQHGAQAVQDLELARVLLELNGLMQAAKASEVTNAGDLSWVCSYLASIGNDLIRAEQWLPAVHCLQEAVDTGRHWFDCAGTPVCVKTLHHLGKVCCAHVSALARLDNAAEATAAAVVEHVPLLSKAGWSASSKAITSLLRHHVRAQLQHYTLGPQAGTPANPACQSKPSPTQARKAGGASSSTSVVASTAAGARPWGRGSVPSTAADLSKSGPGGGDISTGSSGILCIPCATQSLAEVYAAGEADHLGEVLDLCAHEEAAAFAGEEEKAGAGGAKGGPACSSIAGCLVAAFDPALQPHLHARALLAAALLGAPPESLPDSGHAHDAPKAQRMRGRSNPEPIGLPLDEGDHQQQLLRKAHSLILPTIASNSSSNASRKVVAPSSTAALPQQPLLNAHTCAAVCASLLALALAGRAVAAGSSTSRQGSTVSHMDSSNSAGSSAAMSQANNSPVAGLSVQAWVPAAQEWEDFGHKAEEALALWTGLCQRLGSSNTEAGQSKCLVMQLQPQLCLQLLTQLWQIAIVQERPDMAAQAQHNLYSLCHLGMVRPSSQVAGAWSLMQPGMGCAAWAMEPSFPLQSAAEALQCTEQAGQHVQEILAQLESVRCMHEVTAPATSVSIAPATRMLEQCVLKAATCPPTGWGQMWLLLRAQLHHTTGAAHMHAGDLVPAYIHVQEALKLSGAVFRCLGEHLQAPKPQVHPDHRLQLQQQQHGAGCLTWVAASTYMASLLQGARVFEAFGCVEDAGSLLRECSKLSAMLRSPGAGALATLQFVHITGREQMAGGGGQLQHEHEQQQGPCQKAALELVLHCQHLLPRDHGVAAIIAAESAQAQGDISRHQQEYSKASQLYAQGLSALACARSSSGGPSDDSSGKGAGFAKGGRGETKGAHGQQQHPDTSDQGAGVAGVLEPPEDPAQPALAWRAAALQCQLHLRSAKCCLAQQQQQQQQQDWERGGLPQMLQQHLQAAAAAIRVELPSSEGQSYLQRLPLRHRSKCVWPVQEAGLLLLQAECVRSVHDLDAQQQQLGAAPAKDSAELEPGLSIVGVQKGKPGGLHEQFSQALQLDSPPPSQAVSTGHTGALRACSASRFSGSAASGGSEVEASRTQMMLLLRALVQCWQAPQLASHACKALLQNAWSTQLPHAATMFLHLQLGMSTAQQAAAAAAARSSPWAAPPCTGVLQPPAAAVGSQQSSSSQSSSGMCTGEEVCMNISGIETAVDAHEEGRQLLLGARGVVRAMLRTGGRTCSKGDGADSSREHRCAGRNGGHGVRDSDGVSECECSSSDSDSDSGMKALGKGAACKQDGTQDVAKLQQESTLDLQRVDALARRWLYQLLGQLPGGCAVTAVTTLQPALRRWCSTSSCGSRHESDAHRGAASRSMGTGLVVGRVCRGSAPILMTLPPPAAQKLPEWWRPPEASHGNGSSSQQEQLGQVEQGVQQQPQRGAARASARARPGAQSKKAGEEASKGQELNAGGGGCEDRELKDTEGLVLLGLLGQLLEDSGSSMKGLGPLETAAQKAQWWKARVQLDLRMGELLAHMESQWLGPWRVLLSHVPPSSRAQLEGPASALAQEHFGPLPAAGHTAAVVTELVLLVLAHWPCVNGATRGASRSTTSKADSIEDREAEDERGQLSPYEQFVAIHQLCLATQQRGDVAHAMSIVQAFSEAAVGAVVADGAAHVGRGRAQEAGAGAVQAKSDLDAGMLVPEVPRREAVPVTGKDAKPSSVMCEGDGGAVGSVKGRQAAKSSRLSAMQQDRGAKAGGAASKPVGRGRSLAAAAVEEATAASQVPQQAAPPGVPAAAAKSAATKLMQAVDTPSDKGRPVLLVLQHSLHALPWEGMPKLRATHTEVYRMPCLTVAAASCVCLRAAQPLAARACAATSGRADHADTGKGQSCSSRATGGQKQQEDSDSALNALKGAAGNGEVQGTALVDLRSTYFVLNPSGDLADTQACFQDWFAEQLGWQGVVGTPPSAKDLTGALQSHAMFLYFGHGSGEQYLPLASLRRLQHCAANLLMGCSSGRLRLHGSYDPAGAVWSLLLAGCPSVVANLWDVTDRDIDRFSQALLKTWIGEQVKQQECIRSSNRAARGSKKGSKAQEPIEMRETDLVGTRSSIAAAVSGSREACRLPHLIGAAPVCYGLPTYVVWPRT